MNPETVLIFVPGKSGEQGSSYAQQGGSIVALGACSLEKLRRFADERALPVEILRGGVNWIPSPRKPRRPIHSGAARW